MSTWAERAEEYAAEVWPPNDGALPEIAALAIEDGARWQREALLSGETVERAARACFDIRDDAHDDREWGELDSQERELYLCQARAALTEALEGEQ